MKALHVSCDGDVLLRDGVDLPRLEPTSSDLLVKVLTCALNEGDIKFITGTLSRRSNSLVYTPGLEICGIVEAVGAKAAARGDFRIGDRVVSALRPFAIGGGGLAEYVVVEAALSAVVPASIPAHVAASLPLAGVMALHAVKETAIANGSKVLVLGAASCVGALVVQLARQAGASVIAGTTPRASLVTSLKLDVVIVEDAKTKDKATANGNANAKWFEDPRLKGNDWDVVMDCVGGSDNWRNADKVLKTTGGCYAVVLGDMVTSGDVKSTQQLLTLGFMSMWKSFWRVGPQLKVIGQFPTTKTLLEVMALADQGALHPLLDGTETAPRTLTVENVENALAAAKARQTNGKIVFQIA